MTAALEYATPSAQLNESSSSVWQTVDGVATTQSPVVLGQTYHAPQNDQVTLIFTKLPPNPGALTIKQVTVSHLFNNGLNPVTDTAYDITSTMEDGTFEYNLTLPTPTTQNVEVKASEDGQTFVTLGGVSPSDGILTITGLNHFTVFVVVGIISGSTATPFDETGSNILINEFMFDPDNGDDWIELYNRGSTAVDLSNWKLDDNTSTMTTLSGILPAGGFLAFDVSDRLDASSPTGDTIKLINSQGTLVSQVSYRDATNINGTQNIGGVNDGNSVGRQTDGSTTWQAFNQPTKGYNNSGNIIYLNVGAIYPFNSIKSGIDNIQEGGTVNVVAGEYNEADIEVTAPNVIIQGPGTGSGVARAVVNGECGDSSPPAIFHLHADGIILKGFEIDASNCEEHGIHIGGFSEEFQVAGVTVTQNVIYGSYYGVTISLASSYDSQRPNIVSENDISQNEYGVYLLSASNNIIRDNNIDENGTYGIWLNDEGFGPSNNNQILNNTITNQNNDAGIYSGSSISNLTITGNEITDNYTGIYLEQITDSLTISDNQVTNHSSYGIYLNTISDAQVLIGGTDDGAGNIITGNGDDDGGSGIYLQTIQNNSSVSLLNNRVSQNGSSNNDPGIYVGSFSDSQDTLTIRGNTISENSGQGIYINSVNQSTLDVSTNTITANFYEGLLLFNIDSSIATITQNTISQNGVDEEYAGMFIRSIRASQGTSTVTVSGNTISENGDEGIDVFQVNNASLAIGPDNIISSNAGTGINLKIRVTGAVITGNTISGNGVESGTTGIVVRNALGNEAHQNIISGNGVGVQNNDEENFFDATENFWGHSSGPLHNDLNPQGQGDSVSDKVWFSPFYLDENLNTLETLELNTEDLSDFVENGIFGLPDDEEGEALVKFLTVLMQFDFEVAGASGEEVTLPEGTRIERSDDAEFEWDDLTVSDFSEDSIQGLGADFDPEGALQWGIPNVELEFNQPITIDISVGVALNGQTLSVRRSTSGSSGWTSAGIVAPATCVVANGICTFQATKASYFVASSTVPTPTPTPTPKSSSSSSGSGGGGSGGSASPPVCNDTKPGSAPVLTGATAATNSVILNWTEAKDPLTYYLITYGLSSGNPQYGNPNVGGKGTANYTVQNLSGGQTYYFKVRAGNGCMPGDFSNELAATSAGEVVTGPAVGFQAGVLGRVTEESTASAQPASTTQPESQTTNLPFNAKAALVIGLLLLGGFGLFRLLFR